MILNGRWRRWPLTTSAELSTAGMQTYRNCSTGWFVAVQSNLSGHAQVLRFQVSGRTQPRVSNV